jgi:exonuclease VII large subunit
MKTRILVSRLGLGLPLALMLTANAARAETVSASQAQAHVGQVVTVVGAVSGIHKSNSGVTFLDIGGQYPNNAFAAVIFKDDAGKFPDVDALGGKTVEVTGSIRLYQGRPEVVLNDPAQIKAK